MVVNKHISLLQNTPKCFCGQGFSPDPTGELTAISRPPIAGVGGHFLKERRRQDMKERRRKKEVTEKRGIGPIKMGYGFALPEMRSPSGIVGWLHAWQKWPSFK